MSKLKINWHNEASQFKASCGYLVRLLHFVRNDSRRGAMLSPPSRRSNETLIRRIVSRSEVVELFAKRAAMFGLDARIALAIFGALSVISGAALYSAIQNAKATALLTDLNEIGKAWEQYYLDTGQDLTIDGTTGYDPYHVKTGDFVVNPGVSGWNGPYLPYGLDTINNDNILHYPDDRTTNPLQRIALVHTNSTNWVNWVDGRCNTQPDCYIWVYISFFKNSDLSLIKKIDEIVDNSDGADNGNFKYDNITSPGYIHIHLKYAPLPN